MSLMGIDVGTTACKVMAISLDGTVLASAQREYPVLRPEPGWAELDSQFVWEQIQDAIRDVTAQCGPDPVTALAVSSMAEAMTPVSRDRAILGNCLLGFDTRGQETTDLLATLDTTAFYERSGNLAMGVFGGPKLIWQRDNRPKLFERAFKYLNWADLVAYLLGADPVTDYSLANRSLFFDLRRQAWSEETLALVGMPPEKLPGVVQSGTLTGEVSADIAAHLGLEPGAKIIIGAHDQCSSAVGAGVTRAGMALYGLGTFICIAPTYETIPHPAQMIRSRLNVEHHALPGLYVSFYYNLTGGALLKWFRDTLAAVEHRAAQASGEDIYDLLLAEMPDNPTDLMVLPHFAPTGPPYYDDDARGLVAGLRLETTRGELLKGLLEGVTYYFRQGLDDMGAAGIHIDSFRATGGGARSDTWLQMIADIQGRPLARPVITEAGALGAAILAGVGSEAYASAEDAIAALVKIDRVFEPDAFRHEQYNQRFARYHMMYPFMQQMYR